MTNPTPDPSQSKSQNVPGGSYEEGRRVMFGDCGNAVCADHGCQRRAEWNCPHLRPSQSKSVEREEIARIIDPEAFTGIHDHLMRLNINFPPTDDEQMNLNIDCAIDAYNEAAPDRNAALAKADAILSLIGSTPKTQREP